MKYGIIVLLVFLLTACQSTKIKNDRYKIATTSPELGSIGLSRSLFSLQNDFEVRTMPQFENKIRVAIEVVPYNNRLSKIYKAKAEFNQNQAKVNFVDSLAIKPELVLIKIINVTGVVNELNADYNATVFRLLNDTKKFQMVSSIAVALSQDEIAKIRQSDTYYLNHNQDSKYTISLYKQGKKTEALEINSTTIVAYKLSNFCWSVTERGKWYIADMVENGGCKGKTKSVISDKKRSKSLYNM
jgi:hypothetical protein